MNKFLKTVSLQKNSIHQLHTNAKAKLALLKKRGVVVYIWYLLHNESSNDHYLTLYPPTKECLSLS